MSVYCGIPVINLPGIESHSHQAQQHINSGFDVESVPANGIRRVFST
jgi:hypothetical protein